MVLRPCLVAYRNSPNTLVTPIGEAESEPNQRQLQGEAVVQMKSVVETGITQFTFHGPPGALAVNRIRRPNVDGGVRLSRGVGLSAPRVSSRTLLRLS